LVIIDYEDNGDLLLAASVIEQDPEGRWYQLPLASGVKSTVKPQGAAMRSHQLLFWPRTATPSLSLYVESATGISAVKRVRLCELPQGLPALDVRETDGPKRIFGLYV